MADLDQQADRWRAWLLDSVFPLWAERAFDAGKGGFYEGVHFDGAPAAADRRSRTQTRQIYVFVSAGRLGWRGPWREIAGRGLELYLDRYLRPDGLFRAVVDEQGRAVDETATVYDQAFSLFALAAAARAELYPDAAATARRVLGALDESRRDSLGLYLEVEPQPHQANCHMHMLEAALDWEPLDPGGPWTELADRLAKTCLGRFIDPQSGALQEFYDAAWRPLAHESVIEPGHNFEWAWLMERWARRRNEPRANQAARALYRVGRRGVDHRGVTLDELDASFAVTKPGARLWPQTEHLKAALILAEAAAVEAKAAHLQHAGEALSALQLYVAAAPAGQWAERLQPDGRFLDEYTRATSLYHIVCALIELVDRSGASMS